MRTGVRVRAPLHSSLQPPGPLRCTRAIFTHVHAALLAGARAARRHGGATAGDGQHVQVGHLLPRHAATEGARRRRRQATQEVHHALDRRRRQ